MDYREIFYGKQGAPKMKRLTDGLQQIEKSHLEYFEERSAKLSFEIHDRLHNHYTMTTYSLGVYFTLKTDTGLRNDIKIECQELFDSIFKVEDQS